MRANQRQATQKRVELLTLEPRLLFAFEGVPQQPLPTIPTAEFVVDNWDNDVTPGHFGVNDTGGSNGTLGTTALSLSPESSSPVGDSLRLTRVSGSFGGYYTYLMGRIGAPGQFLDTQDIYRGFGGLENRSVEQVRFDVKHALASPLVIKLELKDESGRIVSATRSIPATGAGWTTVSLSLPGSFSGNAAFNYRQVDHMVFVVDDAANAANWTFLLDNLRFVDVSGAAYPDFAAMTNPVDGSLLPQYEEGFLDHVRRLTSLFFVDRASTYPSAAGMIQDRADSPDLTTIGGVGFQLTSYVVDAERGYLTRAASADRVVRILRHLYNAPQGTSTSGVLGYQGFFYHFQGTNGLRDGSNELSPIDTALAICGVVTAGQYFDDAGAIETEIRTLADAIYGRVNWGFMLNKAPGPTQNQFFLAWRPETNDPGYQYAVSGLPGRFTGSSTTPLTIDYYTDEAILIALLAMGSPNPAHRLGRQPWDAIFRVQNAGSNFVQTYPGALFTYQFASTWLDTNLLGADNHPTKPIDFYENTRRAVTATRNYAIANSTNRDSWLNGGGATRWGLSAAAGPVIYSNGANYFADAARPAALNINQNNPLEVGTVTPYSVASAAVHEPAIVVDSLWRMSRHDDLNGDGAPDLLHPRFGFVDAFTYDIADTTARGTLSAAQTIRSPAAGPWGGQNGFAIDNGPMVVILDNYLSGRATGRQFVPGLFMSHPQLRIALSQLFPDLPPVVLGAEFPFEAFPHRLNLRFSENVQPSLVAGDLVLENLTTGQTINPGDFAVGYDGVTNTASFIFTPGALPDGNYRATLPVGTVTDVTGNPVAGAIVFDFFVLAGDANRDRMVNIGDFSIVASRYNLPGTFSQGDFNYSGTVEIGDFSILASRYNASLPEPSAAAQAARMRPFAPATSILDDLRDRFFVVDSPIDL